MADTDRIEMSWVVAAKPKDVYDAWLSSFGHAAMTGGEAVIDARVGGRYSAWGGYIEGRTTKLEKNKRIRQTWRTSEFKKSAPDSLIEIELRALRGQTQLILRHTRLPRGDGAKYTAGWYDNYREPMIAYFGGGY
jgi:activator of HSP90 ATPase